MSNGKGGGLLGLALGLFAIGIVADQLNKQMKKPRKRYRKHRKTRRRRK